MSVVAERYDSAHVTRQGADGMGLIDKLSPLTGSNVLDLGCGTGFMADILAERVGPEGKVTAVDLDKDRLRIAQKRYGERFNIEFLDGSTENFPSGPYDTVFSTFVMHWVKDKESAFRNVYKHLKVGGRFAILCSETCPSIFWELLSAKVKEAYYMCSSDVYESIALKCGFEVEYKSVAPAKYIFANVEEYTDWVFASVNVDSDTIDPNTLEEFTKRFGSEPVEVNWIRIIYIFRKS